MLLALLYSREGEVLGAAMACDQQPQGNRYWLEFTQIEPAAIASGETAHVEIADEELCRRLLAMDFANGYEAAVAVSESGATRMVA